MSVDKPGWTIRSGRTVYDNAWITVREYETQAPTGAPAGYGLVHMKNLALGVLPIDAEGRTILVGQQRFPFGRYSWELPEGGGKESASPLSGAQRELSEEAGLKARNWLPLLRDVHLSNSVTDERAYAFLAWDLSPDTSHSKDVSEDLTIRFVPFADAVGMAVSGEITDVFSLVMLLKTDHLARTGALPGPLAELLQGGA
ncbi:MAG: NUDIX hydrolase [Alphaproteobacteria bacterium]|nr:NUDIX hydrolase [Alphaproteobacteria bacterium]